MEALQHQFPVPPLLLPQDALLQQAVAARALMMATAGNPAPFAAVAAGPGREQCPRCASRDTKFCYYNNYNTAQPRHFCRACRRYWTLGGSLRNVPVGGSSRKRPRRLRRPTRAAMAAAVAAMAATPSATAMTASAGGGPFASPATLQGGLLVSSLLLAGSVSASAAASASPLLEGRLGFDLGLGEDAALAAAGGGATAVDLSHHQTLPLSAGPLPWPEAAILEGDRAEMTTTWKDASGVVPFPPVAALWQELAAAAPVVEAAGLLHYHGGGAPHLLL